MAARPVRAARIEAIGERPGAMAQLGHPPAAVFKRKNLRSMRLLESLGFSPASPEQRMKHHVEPGERLIQREERKRMAKLLRQLAIQKLAAAEAFLLPVIFWQVAENINRGILAFKFDLRA